MQTNVSGKGFLLGLDIGTTTVRAILFDLEGEPVAEAYRESRVYHPEPSWAEGEPEEWWQSVTAVTREALARAAVPPDQVRGVGLSGLMHAVIPVDQRGRPLARAMLWMDQRCRLQASWLTREHGTLVAEVTGRRAMSTTVSAPKVRWLLEHDPALLQRTWKLLLAKDFIRYRLTGTIATNLGDAAGTGLCSRRQGDWSDALLAVVGASREMVAPIREPTDIAGGVTAEAAALTGLKAGTPVVVGADDTACTRLGANALAAGTTCLYLGTAAWVAAPGPERMRFGATATTGAALRWLVKLFRAGRSDAPAAGYTQLLAEAAQVPPGAGGLLFLPHLMGERGPEPRADATGTLFGLTLAHGRPHVVRAVLEGTAFQLRAILEEIGKVREMVTVGGGAKGALWREVIADVTGVTLLVPRVLEAGALGAAILAGAGTDIYPSVEEAAGKLVRVAELRAPNPANRALYDRIYPAFRELEERVAPLYGRLP